MLTRPALVRATLAILALALTAGLPAQNEKKPKAGPKLLDKKQLAERLETFKKEIASKMIPPRVAEKGERRIAKWLHDFQVVQSPHYHVYTNGPTTTVKRFAKSLEELHAFVKKMWPFEDVDHFHRAYIFKSEEEYYDFCVKVAGWSREHAERSAGHASAAYYAAYYQSPKSEVVMHEATHQLVHACLKIAGVGSWFQEGMAEYTANEILGARISGGMRTDLRNGDYYPFPEFVAIPSLIADKHSSRNYTHSGCIIEFMMKTKDPRMQGKFPAFLTAAASRGFGRGPEATTDLFKTVYGMTLEEVDAAFLAFHKVKPKKAP